MRAAAARGSRPGNPGLRAGDPAARRATSEARRASYLARLVAGADAWLPAVQRLRTDGRAWDDVVRYLNARRAAGAPHWTSERLVRAVRRMVAEGMAEQALLAPARPAPAPTGCWPSWPASCGPTRAPRCARSARGWRPS